jgi:hypothetical protein
MNAKELLRKRDLCFKAAHECKPIDMWKIWVNKGNQLHQMAMRSIENDTSVMDRERMLEIAVDNMYKDIMDSVVPFIKPFVEWVSKKLK